MFSFASVWCLRMCFICILVQTGTSCPIWPPKNSTLPSFQCLTVLCVSRASPYCPRLEPEASWCVWGGRSGGKTSMCRILFSLRHSQALEDGNKIRNKCGSLHLSLSGLPSFLCPLLPGSAERWFEITVTVQQTQVLWLSGELTATSKWKIYKCLKKTR